MRGLRNLLVGFAVSFIGSIPLGYLNIVGFQINEDSGNESLISYLLGVILVEAFVIYFTLIFAEKLSSQKQLIRYLELFSIFFMLALSVVFYMNANQERNQQNLDYPDFFPFWIGVVLSGLNFIQLPFWVGWNLYLLNANYISTTKHLKYFYLAGTLAGTFAGMYLFVVSLSFGLEHSGHFAQYVFYAIPLAFLALAIFQAFKYHMKYSAGTRRK